MQRSVLWFFLIYIDRNEHQFSSKVSAICTNRKMSRLPIAGPYLSILPIANESPPVHRLLHRVGAEQNSADDHLFNRYSYT